MARASMPVDPGIQVAEAARIDRPLFVAARLVPAAGCFAGSWRTTADCGAYMAA